MMTSLKAWYLLPLTVLLLLSIVPTVTEVVQSMSDCDEFLLEKKTPQVAGILDDGKILDQNRYKPICQTYDNKRRFVTLYDTKNKIPVFSAYKYRGEGGSKEDKKRPKKPHWKIEPQLESETEDKNMKKDGAVYSKQASIMDYTNDQGYNKGHLFPSSHAFDKSDKISTFTLTNIVPQAISFNGGSWEKMERCVKCILEKYCINNNNVIEGYVVTGAQPSSDKEVKKLNNTINIPSLLWSSFCCYSHKENKWLASAYWGKNDAGVSPPLPTKTLDELQKELNIKAFPSTKCPPSTTVAGFYRNVGKDCQCQ